MVRFILRSGSKSPDDVMVFLEASDEVLTFHEILFILKHVFDSEDSYYPMENGFLGKGMMLSAINCLACGVPLDVILKRFKLPVREVDVYDLRNYVKRAGAYRSQKSSERQPKDFPR